MTDKKLEKYGGTLPEINPKIPYNIGLGSKLAMVSRTTLRKDAMLGIIPYFVNPRNGRLMFQGKDLIMYRNTCV